MSSDKRHGVDKRTFSCGRFPNTARSSSSLSPLDFRRGEVIVQSFLGCIRAHDMRGMVAFLHGYGDGWMSDGTSKMGWKGRM